MSKTYMTALQETITNIASKELTPTSIDEEVASKVKEFAESLTFNRVVQSFWRGYFERCMYYAERSSALSGKCHGF